MINGNNLIILNSEVVLDEAFNFFHTFTSRKYKHVVMGIVVSL